MLDPGYSQATGREMPLSVEISLFEPLEPFEAGLVPIALAVVESALRAGPGLFGLGRCMVFKALDQQHAIIRRNSQELDAHLLVVPLNGY
jgi:hypothetical protein